MPASPIAPSSNRLPLLSRRLHTPPELRPVLTPRNLGARKLHTSDGRRGGPGSVTAREPLGHPRPPRLEAPAAAADLPSHCPGILPALRCHTRLLTSAGHYGTSRGAAATICTTRPSTSTAACQLTTQDKELDRVCDPLAALRSRGPLTHAGEALTKARAVLLPGHS